MPITYNSQKFKLFWYCISLSSLYSFSWESVSEKMPNKSGEERPFCPWYITKRMEGYQFENFLARHWPTLQFVHRSDFTNIHLINYFISQFPVTALFSIAAISISAKIQSCTAAIFPDSYSKLLTGIWPGFVFLQPQIYFSSNYPAPTV